MELNTNKLLVIETENLVPRIRIKDLANDNPSETEHFMKVSYCRVPRFQNNNEKSQLASKPETMLKYVSIAVIFL